MTAVMFAFVRFKDDDVKAVVPTKDVRSFEPKHLEDFEGRKWYEVYWVDDKQSGYFRAQILQLFETRQEAEKRGKRVRIPPRPSDSSDSCLSTSSNEDYQRESTRNRKKAVAEAQVRFRKKQLAMLFSDEEDTRDSHSTISQLKKDKDELEEANRELIKRNKNLQENNSQLRETTEVLQKRIQMLEKALCSRIFEAESRLLTKPAAKGMQNALMAPSRAESAAAFEECLVPETGIGPMPGPSVHQSLCPSAAADCSKECTPAVSPSTIMKDHQSEPLPYEAIGSEVFLGKGLWIPKIIFDRLMNHQKDSVFVREACVEIFSTAGLVGKSVTGAVSNRTKGEAKPALDTTKFAVLDAFFKHYLEKRCSPGEAALRHRELRRIVAGKIADVMKAQKK